MKPFRMLGRSIRDAVKSVIRNFSLSLASISCITITLIIVAVAIMASFNVKNFTEAIEKDMTIVVFVDNDATEDEVKEIEKDIQCINNVEKYTFQTKKEVKDKMQEESEVFKTVLENWSEEESPLKDTFQVKVKDITSIKKTAERIEKIDKPGANVEKVTYGIVIALVLVTVFLIVNTIKLTISARRKAIGIMRLVGASNLTIKLPFIIEGMILGLLGSVVPVIVTTYGYYAFYHHFDGYLYSRLIQLIKPEPFIYQASIIVIIIGIVVGMIGSASAVKRYLKI